MVQRFNFEHMAIELVDENSDYFNKKPVLIPHNGKPIVKMAISPQSKYVVTYSQEDESFVGWRIDNEVNSGPLILDNEVRPYHHKLLDLDFKVSDKNIIMYEGDNDLGTLYL
jgi:hypothetical protein